MKSSLVHPLFKFLLPGHNPLSGMHIHFVGFTSLSLKPNPNRAIGKLFQDFKLAVKIYRHQPFNSCFCLILNQRANYRVVENEFLGEDEKMRDTLSLFVDLAKDIH